MLGSKRTNEKRAQNCLLSGPHAEWSGFLLVRFDPHALQGMWCAEITNNALGCASFENLFKIDIKNFYKLLIHA